MFSKKGKNKQNEEQDILNSTDTELMEEIDLLDEPQDEEKKPKKKLPAWVIFPVLGVVVAGAFGISALTGGGKTADTGTILEVTDVTRGTVQEVYNSSGTIESENTKTYYSPVTAPIKE
ncbi:MAG TPA: RND transporter, partial [Candidatus Mediterraneibacter excrementigallinarum]|nr:RND transporter [Candidatus Mediterraneibacter excrementigallinarum]